MINERNESPTPSEQSVRIGGRRVTLRRAADRLPTTWLGAGIAAGFLLLTAAFGGLRTAPPTPVPTIELGETYTNDQVSIAIDRLVIADSITGSLGQDPAAKTVVLVTTTTNRWNRPLTGLDLNNTVHLSSPGDPGDDEAADDPLIEPDVTVRLTRTDDGGAVGELQPGVAVPLAWMWTVDDATARRIANEGAVEVTIFDQTVIEGNYTFSGFIWGDPTAAAQLVVSPEVRAEVSLTELNPAEPGAAPPTTVEGGG